MRFGVVVFPGSNCDHDAWYALSHNLGHSAEFIWHDSATLGAVDAVILPGGFSYGDYLRCGAIAKFSPVMSAVREFAEGGGLVLGICNGFQVLVESGLLPGALLRNRELKFVCRPVTLRVETTDTPFTAAATKGHDDRVVLRYLDNPNGSLDDIAGICSEKRNVMGMMPHPERASDALLGSTDGKVILESMIHSLSVAAA